MVSMGANVKLLVKLFTHQKGWITFTTSHHFHKCFKDYLCLYTLCPNEILGLLIFSPSDPWCPGACEAFRIEQRVPDFVVSMSSTRSTGHKLAPGSPSKWPFWKRVPCFDCIKQLTFWVVPNRKFREEAKKMQRFQPIGFWLSWISTKIIQKSSPTCQLLQNVMLLVMIWYATVAWWESQSSKLIHI